MLACQQVALKAWKKDLEAYEYIVCAKKANLMMWKGRLFESVESSRKEVEMQWEDKE